MKVKEIKGVNDLGLFPIKYNGKEYLRKDCNEVFLSLYIDRSVIRFDGSIYFTDGLSVFPDGEIEDENDIYP